MSTTEENSTQSGTGTSCPPEYISNLLTHLVDGATEPTLNFKPASDEILQDPSFGDNHDKSTVDFVEHTDLTDEGTTCVDQSGDSTEADSSIDSESMTRGQSTKQVDMEGNSGDDEKTQVVITDMEVVEAQRGDESSSKCEIISGSFDNSDESHLVLNVAQDEETCTELIGSSTDDGVMTSTLSNVSDDDKYSEKKEKTHVESLQEGNTTEISGSGSSCDLLEHRDISEQIEYQKIQNEMPVESLECCNEIAESVAQIHTEEYLNMSKADIVVLPLELQNIEPKISATLSNTGESNIVDNVSESLLKPARKSATSIKNIIDAFECKPLKDSFQVKPIRNIDTDKIESIEGIISQIDNDSCNISTPTVKPTRQSLNKVSEITVMKEMPSDEQANQNAETQNFQELALPRYQILQTKSEDTMCQVVLSVNDEQKVLQTQNPTVEKDTTKEPVPRVVNTTGVRKQSCFMMDLIYWSDPKTTAGVFGVVLAMLGVLCTCSIISIVAWSGLAMIAAGSVQRVFSQTKTRQRRSNKLDDFIKAFSDQNVRENTDLLVAFIHLWFTRMRKIFLVDNIVNTLQVAVLCYVMTYVGSWFNGVTVASILLTALFTLPKLYDSYERQIQGVVARLGNKWKQLANKAKKVEERLNDGKRINVEELF